MPSSLKDFFLNETMRNDVHSYLLDCLKAQAIEKAFNREDTSSVAEAKEMIVKAFNELEILFTSKSEGRELKNEAR